MNDLPWSLASIGILATIVVIGVLAIWKILKDKRSGFPVKDERTQKITGMAATYAFYIGSYFMIALMLTNILNYEFLGVPLLNAGSALISSILVNSITFLIVQWYFNRKGDF
jgi:hypothetical protein